MRSPVDYFTELTDPHVDRTKDHLMKDIIFTTISDSDLWRRDVERH
jgi:hypothetical protein